MRARSRLPKRLGIVGVAVGLAFMALYWYIYQFNPFHFPSGSTPGTYSPPLAYRSIENLSFVLVPGIWLGFFTMDLGTAAAEITWLVASAINFPVYYCVGLLIDFIRRRAALLRESGRRKTARI